MSKLKSHLHLKPTMSMISIKSIYSRAIEISKSKKQQWLFAGIVSVGIITFIVIQQTPWVFYSTSILPLIIQLIIPSITQKLVIGWMVLGLIWSSIISTILYFIIYLIIGIPFRLFRKKKTAQWIVIEQGTDFEKLS
jgi:hypothetical protein